jgi:hypothetical protein
VLVDGYVVPVVRERHCWPLFGELGRDVALDFASSLSWTVSMKEIIQQIQRLKTSRVCL